MLKWLSQKYPDGLLFPLEIWSVDLKKLTWLIFPTTHSPLEKDSVVCPKTCQFFCCTLKNMYFFSRKWKHTFRAYCSLTRQVEMEHKLNMLLWVELGPSENSQNWDPGSGCGHTGWAKPNRGREGCLGRDGLVFPPTTVRCSCTHTRSDCLRIQYRGVKSGQHCTNYRNAILRVWLMMTKNLPIEKGNKFGWYGST